MNSKRPFIQDAEIVSETLNDSGSDFMSFIARQVDKLTSNSRGAWVTETLVLADLAKDNSKLRTAYAEYKKPIDDYFNQINVEKALRMAGPDLTRQIQLSMSERAKNNIPGFLAGMAFGAVAYKIIKKKKK